MGLEVDLQCPLLVGEEIVLPIKESLLVASRDSQGRKRLPQTHEDDASSTLSVEGATFGNGLQPGAYMAQLPLMKERISEDYIPYVHV
jgi:hypothetical protein